MPGRPELAARQPHSPGTSFLSAYCISTGAARRRTVLNGSASPLSVAVHTDRAGEPPLKKRGAGGKKMNTEHIRKMVDDAIGRLAAELDAGKSDELKRYVEAMARFHHYSASNVLLISMQRPSATHVAGYRAWHKLGRQVKQGEQAIRILAPVLRRKRSNAQADDEREGQERDEERELKLVAFKPACVFDITQTDGKPLSEPAQVRGSPGEATAALRRVAASRGIKLRYSQTLGNAQGISRRGSILLKQGLPPAEEFSTLAHELAHELLHRQARDVPKTVRETEAEAIAYVVNCAAGLDTNTASSDYIQLYQGSTDTLQASMERIRDTASIILQGMEDRDGTQRGAHLPPRPERAHNGEAHSGENRAATSNSTRARSQQDGPARR